jgi:hypothetical protein
MANISRCCRQIRDRSPVCSVLSRGVDEQGEGGISGWESDSLSHLDQTIRQGRVGGGISTSRSLIAMSPTVLRDPPGSARFGLSNRYIGFTRFNPLGATTKKKHKGGHYRHSRLQDCGLTYDRYDGGPPSNNVQ